MENEDKTECHHDRVDLFEVKANDGGYFKKTYLDKQPLRPRQCRSCKKEFVVMRGKEQATQYKVTDKTPVFMCKNAMKTHHRCLMAYCQTCQATVLAKKMTAV